MADEGFDLDFVFFAVFAAEEVFEPEGESAQPVDVDAVGEFGQGEVVFQEDVVEEEVVEQAAGLHDVDDVSALCGVADVFDAALFEEHVCKEEIADEAQETAHFWEHGRGCGAFLERGGKLLDVSGRRSDGGFGAFGQPVVEYRKAFGEHGFGIAGLRREFWFQNHS